MQKPPFLSTHEINVTAEKFLRKYHSSFEPPIPIEHISELQLRINTIPIPNLKTLLRSAGITCVDAFISSDFSSIGIDKYTYENHINRSRFSIAHEIGHMLLHREIYSKNRFNTIGEWIEVLERLPDRIVDMLEWQANEFAGLILIPRKILSSDFESAKN